MPVPAVGDRLGAESSLQPSLPGLPTIRAFQAAHATITRHWLTERLQRSEHDLR